MKYFSEEELLSTVPSSEWEEFKESFFPEFVLRWFPVKKCRLLDRKIDEFSRLLEHRSLILGAMDADEIVWYQSTSEEIKSVYDELVELRERIGE